MPNTKAVGVAYSDPQFDSLTVTGASTLTGAVTAPGGITGSVTGNLIVPTATVAATGTNQGNAAAIATGFTLVSGADGTKGVLLPVAAAGLVCIVKNGAAAVLKIWPASGDAINALSVDAAFSVAASVGLLLVAYDATTWYSVPLLPS